MTRPDLIQELEDMPSEDLRELIARAAGIHAHRDDDDGETMVRVLSNVAYALTHARGELH